MKSPWLVFVVGNRNVHFIYRLAPPPPGDPRPRGDCNDEGSVHVAMGRSDHRPFQNSDRHGDYQPAEGQGPGDTQEDGEEDRVQFSTGFFNFSVLTRSNKFNYSKDARISPSPNQISS